MKINNNTYSVHKLLIAFTTVNDPTVKHRTYKLLKNFQVFSICSLNSKNLC